MHLAQVTCQHQVRGPMPVLIHAGVKEAGWTPEEQQKRDSFVLLVGNARLPNSVESRLKFMEQVRLKMLGAQLHLRCAHASCDPAHAASLTG